MKTIKFVLPLLALVSTVFAHVSVAPTQSKPAQTETYTFRVPSEGGRTTTGVVLSVPQGLTIVSIAVPKDGSVSYDRKPSSPGDQISWTIELKPGAVAQFSITATNAANGGTIQWKIQQKYADGTSSDWNPTTKLDEAATPAPASASH